MTQIKAPYNFVPLNKEVYTPNWSNQISHDVPFEDGESGVIEIQITAQTPIFVRNGHTPKDSEAKNDNYKSFSNIDGKHFIPATSIKGAIRNLVEIISFGKMDKISDKKYAIRDLQLRNEYMSHFRHYNIHCGWLYKKNDTIIIENCGIPRRISHKEIDNILNTPFVNTFSDSSFFNAEANRSSLIKYNLAKGKTLTYKFKELPLNSKNKVDRRIKVIQDNTGIKGTIVFTGQPGPRKTNKAKPSGKFYEFVFFDKKTTKYRLKKEDELKLFDDFCFVYKDSPEWRHWKHIFESNGKVPIFMSMKGGQIQHFGLSYLYKLPFEKSIKGFLTTTHKESKPDLAECIFGTSNNNIKLKGRVQFSHAFCENKVTFKELSPYMGGPKPTYYPIYLVQDKQNTLITMLDNHAELKGWKRYPVRDYESYQKTFIIPENQKKNTNPFIALGIGSTFKFKVRYFNLKKEELGALLTVLDLHTNFSHTLGFAKPFGYGIVKFNIVNCTGIEQANISCYKNSFNKLLCSIFPNYNNSKQLKELWAMMQPYKSEELTTPLEYMYNVKDFVTCKNNKSFLEYYTKLIKIVHVEPKITIAEEQDTYCDSSLKQAKLIDGKDLRVKPIVTDDSKIRIKPNDKIEVKIIKKGGNKDKLKFIKKI